MYTSHNGIIVDSPYDDLRFDSELDKNRKSITKNIMCVPVKFGENCVGCLEIANKRDNTFFADEDCKFVTTIEIGRAHV